MTIFADVRTAYPQFVKVADHLEQTCGLFIAKSLLQLKDARPDLAFAEKLCSDAYALVDGDEERLLENAESMVDFSLEVLTLQRELENTGRYLYSTFAEVDAHVYKQSAEYGPPYIWAMYFTHVFWVTHARVWRFFLDDFATQPSSVSPSKRVLEIPSGNGLFVTHFLLRNPEWRGVALDLSDSSIAFTKQVLVLNNVAHRALVKQQDFFRYSDGDGGGFDRIICGEFLEHVEDPASVLRKLRDLLEPTSGRLFLTAAVWSANIDHIYLYESAQAVRDHIAAAGLAIERELVQNVLPDQGPDKARVPMSYCAILRVTGPASAG